MTAEIEIADAPTALYRLYSAAGDLLYVGITDHLKLRLAAHAKDKPWWGQVARKTVTWHPSKDEAAAAEAQAIHEERPAHNAMEPAPDGNSRHGRNRHALVGWHPPTELADWARTRAKHQGRRLSDILTEALEEYRERHS
jgi:predicted GIY-YIG superfamily endonuclease